MLHWCEFDTDRDNTLSTEELADALEVHPGDLEAMLGPSDEVATIRVMIDQDADFPDWVIPDESAILMVRGGYESTLERYSVGDKFPTALVSAWEHLKGTYGPDGATRMMKRYARLFGYEARDESWHGYSQGDWHDVLIVERAGEPIHVESVKSWAYGDVFGYSVEVANPVGDDWQDSCFGYYGHDDIEWAVDDALKRAVEDIRAEVRSAKSAAASLAYGG